MLLSVPSFESWNCHGFPRQPLAFGALGTVTGVVRCLFSESAIEAGGFPSSQDSLGLGGRRMLQTLYRCLRTHTLLNFALGTPGGVCPLQEFACCSFVPNVAVLIVGGSFQRWGPARGVRSLRTLPQKRLMLFL